MKLRSSVFTILTVVLACCPGWSSALFWKSWKSGRGHSGTPSYGSDYYGSYGYGNPSYESYGYGNPSSGYGNYGYNHYAGGYGYNYPSYSSYHYPKKGRRTSGQRQGRTYSQIARVLKPDGFVGLGGSKFLPHTKFSPLWG
ncbi:sulfur globule protein CV2 [Drosophila bipectinata]|uniref:sulfur globule protein CV2 n=1 Tax=Drosophila bipectinata TaxID=42026 RepID=UPI001C8A6C2F|nr:neuropeptide-like protein 29 [Drosophila bipectinata]